MTPTGRQLPHSRWVAQIDTFLGKLCRLPRSSPPGTAIRGVDRDCTTILSSVPRPISDRSIENVLFFPCEVYLKVDYVNVSSM